VLGARRGSPLTVQAWRGGHWVAAGSATVGRRGAYGWTTSAAGTYRVVSGAARGPAVQLG
jgi:hypothetical protein